MSDDHDQEDEVVGFNDVTSTAAFRTAFYNDAMGVGLQNYLYGATSDEPASDEPASRKPAAELNHKRNISDGVALNEALPKKLKKPEIEESEAGGSDNGDEIDP